MKPGLDTFDPSSTSFYSFSVRVGGSGSFLEQAIKEFCKLGSKHR